MLITRRQGRLTLVAQPDHGGLAGQLCERWGNEQFATPTPREALLVAAAHHDDGWFELDGQPAFNDDAQRPAHFVELPLPKTVGPYGRGVDSVYARDPHAGALVSMHWAGLYSKRWGLQSGGPAPYPLAAEVVAEQECRWVAAVREAWDQSGLRSEFEANTWHAYEVLQALDFISLAVCLLDPEQPSGGGEELPMPVTLPHVDQPPGKRIIPTVPLAAGGEHRDVKLWVSEPGTVMLDPYPFGEQRFQLELPAREMEDQRYGSAEEAAAAYREAPVRKLRVTIAAA
jgi:hypothetical protein